MKYHVHLTYKWVEETDYVVEASTDVLAMWLAQEHADAGDMDPNMEMLSREAEVTVVTDDSELPASVIRLPLENQ